MAFRYLLMGHCSALMRAVMTVACSTVCPIWVSTSVVRIFKALPVSRIISGSQSTLNTSPTIGSSTLKGNLGSSCNPFRNLGGCCYQQDFEEVTQTLENAPGYSDDTVDALVVM